MAGLRDQQKQKRRDAIMAVSARLFGQQGYAATSMEEIAAAAELSVGTLYNYFKSKGDITLALYRADLELVRQASEAVIAEPPADPVQPVTRTESVTRTMARRPKAPLARRSCMRRA